MTAKADLAASIAARLLNRVAYDLKVPLTDIALARLGEPRRGEADGVRLIRRLVALQGDVVDKDNLQLSILNI